MKIHIPKIKASSKGSRFVMMVMLYYTVSYILVYTFRFPRTMLYFGDIFNVMIFMLALRKKRGQLPCFSIIGWMLTFTIVGLCSSIINQEGIGLIIWGIRNNLRFFILFYSIVVFFKMIDVAIVLNILKIMFWISVPLCAIEKFYVSYPSGTIVGDMIGGFFWNYSGSNLSLNIILITVVTLVSSQYFKGEEKLKNFIITSGAALFMAATAELKVYLAEYIVIIILTAVMAGISFKNIIKVLLGCILFSSFISLFVSFNMRGDNYADNYTLAGFFDYATRDSGYNGTGDLNRLTGISIINNTIFEGQWIKKLFGIGLGNAEYTNFFTSDFYNQYKYLNYQWFHDIWMFIETGFMGVISYISIFVAALIKSISNLKKTSLGSFVSTMIILMLILYIYNITLRAEAGGFILFMILAIPYLYRKEKNSSAIQTFYSMTGFQE